MSNKPRILHVSGDFPDTVEPFKTPVIRDLLDLTVEAFDHRVISINRKSTNIFDVARTLFNPSKLAVEGQAFEYGTALTYRAPGKGIRHRTSLEKLGEHIARECTKLDRPPALLAGHKLTIEGIAVRRAADILGLPYLLSIQGNTDSKILKHRPDLRGLFAEIYHGANVVFPFTPWALARIEEYLGKRSGGVRLLPCPTDLDSPQAPHLDGEAFLTVFHLKNWREKNFPGLVEAWKILGRTTTPPPLKVIGGGSEKDIDECRKIAKGVPQVQFAGPMGRSEVSAEMAAARAFIMPSKSESFGLVFVESLFAGSPIIYPKGSAIDGYFDAAPFATRVDAHSPESIAEGVRRVIINQEMMVDSLAKWQCSPDADRFTRKNIAIEFAEGLHAAMAA